MRWDFYFGRKSTLEAEIRAQYDSQINNLDGDKKRLEEFSNKLLSEKEEAVKRTCELEEQLKELSAERDELQKKPQTNIEAGIRTEYEERIKILESENKKLEESANKLLAERNVAQIEMSKLEKELNDLSEQKNKLEEELNYAEEYVLKMARGRYRAQRNFIKKLSKDLRIERDKAAQARNDETDLIMNYAKDIYDVGIFSVLFKKSTEENVPLRTIKRGIIENLMFIDASLPKETYNEEFGYSLFRNLRTYLDTIPVSEFTQLCRYFRIELSRAVIESDKSRMARQLDAILADKKKINKQLIRNVCNKEDEKHKDYCVGMNDSGRSMIKMKKRENYSWQGLIEKLGAITLDPASMNIIDPENIKQQIILAKKLQSYEETHKIDLADYL